jgi:hypothetical protein
MSIETHPFTTLLDSLGVTLTATLLGYRSEDHEPKDNRWPHFEWSVTVKRGEQSHTTTYKTGVGHAKPFPKNHGGFSREFWYNRPGTAIKPTAADVLHCLLSDASCGADTFEDFCGNLGYDTDSRKSLETYLICQKTGVELRRLLGEHYSAVLKASQDF